MVRLCKFSTDSETEIYAICKCASPYIFFCDLLNYFLLTVLHEIPVIYSEDDQLAGYIDRQVGFSITELATSVTITHYQGANHFL